VDRVLKQNNCTVVVVVVVVIVVVVVVVVVVHPFAPLGLVFLKHLYVTTLLPAKRRFSRFSAVFLSF
jgi:hypothetical protein